MDTSKTQSERLTVEINSMKDESAGKVQEMETSIESLRSVVEGRYSIVLDQMKKDNDRLDKRKRCNCSCFEIDQEMDAILLIIGIAYGVCRIVIISVQQCTYFLFFVNLLSVGVNYQLIEPLFAF
jgi:hypothetical protein